MKKWFVITIIALVSTLSHAADGWVAGELKEASAQLDQRQFAQAFEICHNLLLINRAAPLGRNASEEARLTLGAAGRRVKAVNPKIFSEEFLARAKRLNFVQVGCAWMPAEAKAQLAADAAAKLENFSQAKVCPQCKGACVADCPNCQDGKAKCIACNGTGRATGGGTFARVTCPVCSGKGKSECTFCRGCGYVACPKCDGTGLGK
ncbi:MAG: hypothetical protein NTY01_09020 [Verrucomicrobia bacterium]|nr:hypothetical protein [Verrucomicrobiota bacterium]